MALGLTGRMVMMMMLPFLVAAVEAGYDVIRYDVNQQCPQPGAEAEWGMCEVGELPFTADQQYQCLSTPPHQCPQHGGWVQEGSVCLHPPPPLHPSLAFNCTSGKWTRADSETLIQHREKRIIFLIGLIICAFFCNRGNSSPPNHPPELTNCPKDIHVKAPPGKNEVNVTWKKPNASDPDGGSLSVHQRHGLAPGSVFPEGRSYVTYEAKDGGGLVSNCSFMVNVDVVKCPIAWPPVNGQRPTCTGAPAENQYGSSCHFSCNQGYQIEPQAQSVVTCQQNKTWSHPFPTCSPVSCGDPGSVAGGNLTCARNHTYPSWCSVRCKPGYRPRGTVVISCTAVRTWIPKPQGCEDKEAPEFPEGCPPDRMEFSAPRGDPVALTWDDPVTTDNSGEAVTLTSSRDSGSPFPPGFHSVKITATDTAGNSRSCKFFVYVREKRCPSLFVPDGSVVCDHGNLEGSKCTASCNDGHRNEGEATLTCGSNSTWSPAVPVCEEVTCPEVPIVERGEFRCYDGSHRYLSRCFLRCHPGYSVQSPGTITCGTDGNWSLPGSCRDVQPPSLDCPDNIEVFASRLGEYTNVSWTPPAVTDNSGENIALVSDVISGSHFKVGVTSVTYTATDYNGNKGTCRFSVSVMTLSCDPPDLEDPARNRTLMYYDCSEGHVHGARCTLSCFQGYPLLGATSITCERDDSQYPPLMSWQFNRTKPECKENNCPDLDQPLNGALTCHLSGAGPVCFMSCNDKWDIPVKFDGQFLCPNSLGYWRPSVVPNCTEAFVPNEVNLPTKLYYFPNTCNVSMQQIRENFITALKNSEWKDACVNVPSCTADNVQVFCGPVSRRRRSILEEEEEEEGFGGSGVSHNSRERRRREANGIPWLIVRFTITMDYVQNGTAEETFTVYENIKNQIVSLLKLEGQNGTFTLNVNDEPVPPNPNYTRSSLSFSCPEGTKYVQRYDSQKPSCVGCSKGHYLKDGQCQQCPVGQYTELDNATSCTPCPSGFSTLTNGSSSRDDCKEVCTRGHFSPNGFTPCQPCPAGQYQSRDQALTCDPCPVGTWTVFAGAKSKDTCDAADVKLSPNVSLSVSLTSEQSAVTVSTWLKLLPNSSLSLDLQTPTLPSSPLSLLIFSEDAADTSSDVDDSLQVAADRWMQVVMVSLPGNNQHTLSVYHDGRHLLNTSLPPLPTPFTATLTTTVLQGKALVSGVHGERRSWGREEVEAPSSSCTQHLTTNVLTWSPQPRAVTMPSQCDAVDECQSSPCGGQGRCENTLDGFLCHCQHGWTGTTCQDPPDACYKNQCQNDAQCQPAGHNYTCVCQDQFSGDLCELEKVDGGWGEWEEWSECNQTCEGRQHRQRFCNNPAPVNEGSDCTGLDSETQSCGEEKCTVDGGWSLWSDWSACSATCGGGETTRSRRCDNPAPQNGGADCGDATTETLTCASDYCPVHGGWGSWREWSPCSATCGDGTQSRERSCDSPFPANGGRPCKDSSNERRICNLKVCPECSQLLDKEGTRLNCTEVDHPVYLKTCRVMCTPGYTTPTPAEYTCGQTTGYLWDFEREDVKVTDHAIQYCNAIKIPKEIHTTIDVPIPNAPCDKRDAVRYQVQENIKKLPCVNRQLCQVQVQTGCDNTTEGRRNHSSGSVTTSVSITVDFGQTVSLVGGDNSTVQKAVDKFTSTDQSAAMLALNDTETFFTVTVDGATITPDVNATSYIVNVACPPGSGVSTEGGVCADCPAGFYEQGGVCVACPMGQYQDQTASTSCKPCPESSSWYSPGATDISQCVYGEPPTTTTTTTRPTPPPIGIILGVSLAAVVVVIFLVVVVICARRKLRWRAELLGKRAVKEDRQRQESPSPVGQESSRDSERETSLSVCDPLYEDRTLSYDHCPQLHTP